MLTFARRVVAATVVIASACIGPGSTALADDTVVVEGDAKGGAVETTVGVESAVTRPTSEAQRQSSTATVTCAWAPADGLNELLSESPAGSDARAAYEEGGRFYDVRCSDGSLTLGVYVPPGEPAPSGAVTAGSLALLARNRLPLPLPVARHSPVSDAVVNLATWWWVDPRQWRLLRQRTQAGPVWAEVTARPVSSRWDPGDGSEALMCVGGGVPYDTSREAAVQSSPCTHVYTRSSAGQPGRATTDWFTVTVTVTWAVSWRGSDGSSGVLPAMSRSSSFALRVVERQTVVTGTSD